VRRRLLPPLVLLALALVLLPASLAAAAVPRPRIVGGTDAAPGAFPSIAALVVPGFAHDIDGQFCGGTVIAPYAILTAAHCIVQLQPDTTTRTLVPGDFVVVTGTASLAGTAGQHLAVRRITTHPGFSQGGAFIAHDAAVVLTASATTAPPARRSSSTPVSGSLVTAFGWGATDLAPAAPSTFPGALQQASFSVQPGGTCQTFPEICAGLTSPNICIGDSGGPLVRSTAAGFEQVGIISAILTPDAANPTCGVDSSEFTDVALYGGWIDQQLAPAVSGVTVSALTGGTLHVAWNLDIGGATPTVTVTTSDAPLQPHPAAPGATSLSISGLPAHTSISAQVTVTNGFGPPVVAQSVGSVSLAGASLPAITGAAVANGAIGAQVATNGATTRVTAQYGVDTTHLTTSPARALTDGAAAQKVSIPLTGLKPATRYRVRLVAQSTGGTATSAWLTLTTPAVKPVARALPKLRGTARVGRTLSCSAGSWTAAPAPAFSYRWRIGGKVPARATRARLKLTRAMAGKKVSCAVTARNVAGRVTARSAVVTVRR
jgi:secreted trypsin-like serine protease